MNEIKVGMISFAHMHAVSYLHALARRNDVKIVGIADEEQNRVKPYLDRYDIPYFADYHELLRQDVDAVIVCSENVRHAEIAIAAARANKHVLCEKPLGLSEDEMRQMIQACRDHGVQLMTAFPCRFLTSVVEAKQAIDRGDIGEIVAMKGTNRGTMPGGWFIDKALSGGGAVLDHTVHVTDLMNWFTGFKPVEVYAHAETLFHDTDIDDAGMVHILYENGVFAVLDPSWSRNAAFPTWGDVTLEVVGTNGCLYIDAFAQKNEVYCTDRAKGEWRYWGDNMNDGLIDGFVDALRQGSEVPVTGEDGCRSARVALAAYQSAQTGRPVQIAEG